ncbi:hypothetical protein H2203_000181 [Taxawa tesnikishii (nom. ined.)]|nr:hypothetical protein H2203_000181 [Dothideales sp. JES 119]
MFSSHHLTITTPHKVHTWDLQGLHTIFASSRGGICAAKESEKSWGLGADEGQVRLLEYAPNAKSLFLGTSISGSVQCYSIHEEKLLRPAHPHPSPPTVFAVSPSTHLLLSASENPTVVYLQNLSLNTRAHQLHPAASDAPVVAAAFHPDRHDVFLLAFKDGTLAAYDATKTPVRTGHGRERQVGDTDTRGREIARFRNLHRVTNVGTTDRGGVLLAAAPGGYDRESRTVAVGARSVGITSAAFLPGYHTRAISLDEIVVDPDGGRVISLDWAHGASPKPLSSEPVLSVVQEEETQPRQRRKRFVAKDAGREEVPSMTNALPVVDYGTVQQSPAKKLSFPPEGAFPPPSANYLDLFSPVKQDERERGKPRGRRKSTGLAFFAPYLKSTKTAEGNDDPNYVSYPVSVHDVDDRMANSATHAVLTPREESKSTTEQSLSASSNGLGDDIWVTSDSDHESRTQKRRLKKRPLPRPVAAVSSTTMSLPAHLTGDFPESSTSLSAATSDTPTLTSPDVTTTDVFEPVRFRHPTFADAGAAQSTANTGAYDTARTHLEEAVDCTPEPEDIQTLLPRSSSFEPTRETRVTHAPLLERNEEVVGAKQRDGGGSEQR